MPRRAASGSAATYQMPMAMAVNASADRRKSRGLGKNDLNTGRASDRIGGRRPYSPGNGHCLLTFAQRCGEIVARTGGMTAGPHGDQIIDRAAWRVGARLFPRPDWRPASARA